MKRRHRHRRRHRHQHDDLLGHMSNSEELEVEYDFNPTDLYLHIINSDWEYSLMALHDNPIEAKIWVIKRDHLQQSAKCRFLPIHSACARQPPFEIVSALLDTFPEGASKRDGNGMYPLHYACANQASPQVIGLLLDTFPDANFDRLEGSGTLPIHLLARWGASAVSVVDIMLDGNVSLACARDGDGQLPLDLAFDAEYYDEREGVIGKLKEAVEVAEEEEEDDDSTISSTQWSRSLQDKSTTSFDMMDQIESPDRRQIIKIQNEIDYLKERRDLSHVEAEDEIAQEWKAVREYITQMESNLSISKIAEIEQRDESERPVSNGTDSGERSKGSGCSELTQEEKVKLAHVMDENREMEKQLQDAEELYFKYKHKTTVTQEALTDLTSNLEKLMEEQKVSLERTRVMEEQNQVISAVRQTRLEEMMNEEKEFSLNIISQERQAMERTKTTGKLVEEEEVVLTQLRYMLDEVK